MKWVGAKILKINSSNMDHRHQSRMSESLSKTTELILHDSLLQEVCINSCLAGRSPNLNFFQFFKEHKLHLFFHSIIKIRKRANYDLLNQNFNQFRFLLNFEFEKWVGAKI